MLEEINKDINTWFSLYTICHCFKYKQLLQENRNFVQTSCVERTVARRLVDNFTARVIARPKQILFDQEN